MNCVIKCLKLELGWIDELSGCEECKQGGS
jgi:hypothetical protein